MASPLIEGALKPSSAGPSRSDALQTVTQGWDNSGWTVATSGSKASAAVGLNLPPWLLLGAAALAAVVWVRLKKS
jgi:disulfide bond formation protein DsbB